VSETCNCVSIFQRLKLSPDEWLEQYVKDNDIIDIDNYDSSDRGAHHIEEDTEDVDHTDEPEGDDINDDRFPDFETEELYCQDVGDHDNDIAGMMDIDHGDVVDHEDVYAMLKSPTLLGTTVPANANL
jgi:hypothetical protein